MKKLVITLPKYKLADYILVNGENVSFKKDKSSGLFVAEYQTEEEFVELSTDKYNPFTRWSWWLIGMFFFIITFFGLFDVHEKNGYINDYVATIGLVDGDNVVNLVPKRGKGPVFDVQTTCVYNETSNNKDITKQIKRRRTVLLLSKIGLILACLVVGVMLALVLILHAIN